MFEVTLLDINRLLADYGIGRLAVSFEELQRYHYEENDPESREVRLIVKANLGDESLVIRFKNESDVSLQLIERQSEFARLLRDSGIASPIQYRAGDRYARWYKINGYEVIVTIEECVEGEITCVDAEIAEKTGTLLAQMHDAAESNAFHVDNAVLFDPFAQHNDLFEYAGFMELEAEMCGENLKLFKEIVAKYASHMDALLLIRAEPRYAVQGDISDCNLYMTADGNLGVYDFNRCGDNNLFCDAVMQAVFEARLMDYPESLEEDREGIIMRAFLKGYQSVRQFTPEQLEAYRHLYAVIDAFWSADIKWNDDSLINAVRKSDGQAVRTKLESILRKIQ